MPRQSDIKAAFVAAVQLNPKGYQYLRTADFVRELGTKHWHFSMQEANDWIAYHQIFFVDKTPDFSENRLWMMRAMGRIM
ncbi:TPA: hypothetical protein ACXE9F_003804 [Pluralibacter gergoviae]